MLVSGGKASTFNSEEITMNEMRPMPPPTVVALEKEKSDASVDGNQDKVHEDRHEELVPFFSAMA